MPLIDAQHIPASVATIAAVSQDLALSRHARGYHDSDATRLVVDRVSVGGTTYPLRNPVSATFVPGPSQLVVEGFSPTFVGEGTTRDEAMNDWACKVHSRIQELLVKRPFEMTDADRQDWDLLRRHVDVTVYRNTTPMTIRQFGRVTQSRPYPTQVRWDDGRRELLSLSQVDSPEFVTFPPGQTFEAVVARDPLTSELLRIVHITKCSPPLLLSHTEQSELLDDIGSSKHADLKDW